MPGILGCVQPSPLTANRQHQENFFSKLFFRDAEATKCEPTRVRRGSSSIVALYLSRIEWVRVVGDINVIRVGRTCFSTLLVARMRAICLPIIKCVMLMIGVVHFGAANELWYDQGYLQVVWVVRHLHSGGAEGILRLLEWGGQNDRCFWGCFYACFHSKGGKFELMRLHFVWCSLSRWFLGWNLSLVQVERVVHLVPTLCQFPLGFPWTPQYQW